MTAPRILRPTLLALLALGLAATPTLASEIPAPVAIELDSGGASWFPQRPVGGFSLTLSGPSGIQTWYAGPDEALEIDLATLEEAAALAEETVDGLYNWEARAWPALDGRSRSNLYALRANDQRPTRRQLSALGVDSPESFVASGSFRVEGSAIVLPDLIEDGSAADAPSRSFVERSAPTSRPGELLTRDQVILDDLIVDGSACIGQDCVNGESFGFDTIRLKENNLRIKFQDTSNSGSFPSNDWQLTANESENGGANKFSIDDIDGGRTPFTIEASAPTNSLYVDDGGRIGLGTSTPVVEMHVVDGDSPTLRLAQDGSSGFQAQTWDVAGNETNFFVRDASNGSKIPFKIIPNAPTNSLYVAGNGDVGLGTASPDANLDIERTSGDATLLLTSTSGSTSLTMNANAAASLSMNSTTGTASVALSGSGNAWTVLSDATGNFAISDSGASADAELLLDSSGNLTTTGTVNAFSDRNAKENFTPIDGSAVLERVAALPITRWNYRHDPGVPHIGPMAQDFHAAFGVGASERHIALNDAAGVSLLAVQELYRQLQARDAQIEALQERLLELEHRLETELP